MADDRPANDDLAAVVAELRRDLADLRSTALARASRLPTGSIEPTILPAPKTDTLFLQGQTLNRGDYPVLWQWVQDNNLIRSGLFTNGNGSSTFGLPDLRGRSVVGATTARAVGPLFGSTTSSLTNANLPSHNHSFTTDIDTVRHSHAFSTGVDSIGHEHESHGHDIVGVAPFAPGTGSTPSNPRAGRFTAGPNRAHVHGGRTDIVEIPHNHTGTTNNTGSGDSFNTEDPAISINWLIWT